jgi:BirA family biotin operon repressor/biotin-[acetyl-CoA-carboxylase] ligase
MDQVPTFTYDSVTSTMIQARLLLKETHPPFCVHSHTQSQGYGRLGRSWQSSLGNLFMTLVIDPPLPLKRWYELSFLTSIALFHTLHPLLGQALDLRLKWPNDIMVQGKKIAGILLEADSDNGVVLIGIGVNCAHSPLALSTCLQEWVTPPPVEVLKDALIDAFLELYTPWCQGSLPSLYGLWQKLGPELKCPLSISYQETIYEGVYEGLTDKGALILKTPAGKKMFYSGDVLELR